MPTSHPKKRLGSDANHLRRPSQRYVDTSGATGTRTTPTSASSVAQSTATADSSPQDIWTVRSDGQHGFRQRSSQRGQEIKLSIDRLFLPGIGISLRIGQNWCPDRNLEVPKMGFTRAIFRESKNEEAKQMRCEIVPSFLTL